MIIFDLEWNSGQYERLKLNEVIQLGAVKLESLGGRITDTLNLYIRPKAHKRYSPPVKELPDLDKIESSHLDFAAAMDQFFAWCGEDRTFGTWGTSDFAVLLENFHYWKLSPDRLPLGYYNLQAAFAMAAGAKNQVALHCAVEYCGFPDAFDYHSPLNDSMYTALVTWAFDQKLLDQSQRSPKVSGSRGESQVVDLTVHPPRWEGRRLGPYGELAELLNARACRLAPCPQCKRRARVPSWSTAGDGLYYSRFACHDHGSWLLRLKVWSTNPGQLFAQAAVLELTEGAKLLLRSAKGGKTFQCQALRRRRQRRKRRRSPRGEQKPPICP